MIGLYVDVCCVATWRSKYI